MTRDILRGGTWGMRVRESQGGKSQKHINGFSESSVRGYDAKMPNMCASSDAFKNVKGVIEDFLSII